MKTDFNELQAVWSKGGKKCVYPPLMENLTVDVAIVGAGVTGLSTAYLLAKTGKRVAILEQGQVGKGTTGFSTGNLYAPVAERLAEISRKHNEQTMREVATSRVSAIAFIEDRVREFQLDCDFQRVSWHLFTTVDSGESNETIQKEYQALRATGLTINEGVPEGFPVEVSNLLTLSNQAQINPFRYVEQLAEAIADGNCKIFENTKVLDVKHGTPCLVETAQGRVTAENVLVATHTPKGIYAVPAAMRTCREFAFAVRLSSKLPNPGIYWHLHSGSQYSIRPYREGSEEYFTPVASASTVLKENAMVVGHLLNDYLFYGEVDELKEIKPGEGKTVKIDGEHLAAFRDEMGEIHLVSGTCTHMGCVVSWNSIEKSWDCPCHGSRFSVEGEVLEGPAYKALAKPTSKEE